jgi:osmoprotectant transport system substrate-binding protein
VPGGVPKLARVVIRVRAVVAALAAAALGLAACSDDGGDGGTGGSSSSSSGERALTVGGATYTESLILQQLYGQLLTKAGYTVTYRPSRDRQGWTTALMSGQVDVVPEYAASLAEFLNRLKNGPEAPAVSSPDPVATVNALRPLAEARGLDVLKVSAASDQDGFAMSRKAAAAGKITTLSQLAAKQPSIRLAADAGCADPARVFCKAGLEKTYRFQVTVDPLGFGTTAAKEAVVAGEADLALTATTDGTLDQLGLVLLEDDRRLQSAENVLPVVNRDDAGTPQVAAALDPLAAALTTEDLARLNLEVDGERRKPADVAEEYLSGVGLL